MDHLQIISSEFRALTLPNAPLLTLGVGYAWLEGPVWFADARHLLVSDLPNDRILRWTEESGISTFQHPSSFANGHTRDRQGRLLSCSNTVRGLLRTELDGSVNLLVDRYKGKRFNGPNDLIVHSDGSIWFTDPLYGGSTDYEGGKHEAELPPAVYRFDPVTSNIEIVANDFKGPNGLCFSPDEKSIYISESGAPLVDKAERNIRVFDVGSDSSLSNGRIFAEVSPGFSDGLRCDEGGRTWTSAGDGVHCFDAKGKLLGKILTGCTVTNLVFGGRNRSRLFICASQTLMAVYTNVRGAQKP